MVNVWHSIGIIRLHAQQHGRGIVMDLHARRTLTAPVVYFCRAQPLDKGRQPYVEGCVDEIVRVVHAEMVDQPEEAVARKQQYVTLG
ncbi:MAG: hypothetical protein ACRCU1_04270, partial [Alsobacter sp.]